VLVGSVVARDWCLRREGEVGNHLEQCSANEQLMEVLRFAVAECFAIAQNLQGFELKDSLALVIYGSAADWRRQAAKVVAVAQNDP
jgi:hypothetical protein